MSMAKKVKVRTMTDRIEEMHAARLRNRAGGGEDKLQKQRDKGKMTARERLDALLDEGTFQEIGLFRKNRTVTFGMDKADMPADGVVTGTGAVLGRPVHVASQDFTVMGGSAGETHSIKVVEMMESALKCGTPFVFINDSGGARVQEGIDSLSGYGQVFYANVKLSGAVPQVSIICGPCAGGAAYSPALTDFVIQTRKAHMFITGPNVIEQVTGEKVTQDALGGADTHMAISGVNHFVADDDAQAILIAKKLLSFLPSNNTEDAPIVDPDPYVEPDETMAELVPPEGTKGYDVRTVIARLVDHSDFLEVQAGYAMNIVVGFARINGRSVGIVASQPNVMAGVLDINASDKGSKFIRFCNAFNIPIVTLVDVPGFLPGVAQDRSTAASSATARRCCTHTRRPPSRRSPSCCARRTAARTSPWAARTSAPTRCSPGRPRRSPSWARRARRRSCSSVRSMRPRIRKPVARSSWTSTARRSQRRSWPRPVGWSTTSSTLPTPVGRSRWRSSCSSTSASCGRPRSTASGRCDRCLT